MSIPLIERKPDWRLWVTPGPLAEKAIHRWYVFPHSFTSDLVHALIDEWGLGPGHRVLDPFAGAGTTLLAAKERGISATGYDISPLAVFASRVKTARHDAESLAGIGATLQRSGVARRSRPYRSYPELVRRALPGRLLVEFDDLATRIDELDASRAERAFFKLALLSTIPKYSRAVATGGWLSWVRYGGRAETVRREFGRQIDLMLADLEAAPDRVEGSWRVHCGDARALPESAGTFSAVITSPPYPNRHDYTRVFGVELMFGFLDANETEELRHQSFHSHPEARPTRPKMGGYEPPAALARAVARVRSSEQDPRVATMLEGYFQDLFLALREIRRTCQRGARVGCVVGNARYRGIAIRVDELTAEIGEMTGLRCEKLVVARYRGNSAQQMGRHGRKPSRESVVVFRKR